MPLKQRAQRMSPEKRREQIMDSAVALIVIGVLHADLLPLTRRLVRFDRRSADLFDQQTRRREGLIADHFSRQPHARSAREELRR